LPREELALRIAVVHPYKHHVYYSANAVKRSGNGVTVFLGYYNRGDLLDKMLLRSPFRTLVEGYRYPPIDDDVRVCYPVKLMFLLSRKWPSRFEGLYLKLFERWVIRSLKGYDGIHVLQDYCNDVIAYAIENGLAVVYEQIIAYDMAQYYDYEREAEAERNKLEMEKRNLDAARAVIMASDFVKDSILQRISRPGIACKMAVIPYGADTYGPQHRIRKCIGGVIKFLIVASIEARKGFQYLVPAFADLLDLPVSLSVIGAQGESSEPLMREIEKSPNINYLGTVPHKDIVCAYYDHDIFILPSLAEGSSLSVYEALASGMPCIISANVGGVVTDGKDGFVIPVKDKLAIEESVRRFVDDRWLIEKMSLEARKTAESHTWDLFERRVAELYRNL